MQKTLRQYIQYKNRTKNNSTKFAPNNIRDLTDQNLIDIIMKNILKLF